MESITTLRIREPKPYWSEGDEDWFFKWLEGIPSVISVTRKDGLNITLKAEVDDFSLRELIGLFTRYEIQMSGLQCFCTTSNQNWFRNTEMFWYQSIFE